MNTSSGSSRPVARCRSPRRATAPRSTGGRPPGRSATPPARSRWSGCRRKYGVYGAWKVHAQSRRECHKVARCTVERLMRVAGL
ncbi:IS3 family transposase [Curtobacterium sp. A7_M15]|uniref:IS3 family transposase n=1 Tax=Curtobacterium sp. A7_M15 TaxID=3065241 RepID=UPI00351FE343